MFKSSFGLGSKKIVLAIIFFFAGLFYILATNPANGQSCGDFNCNSGETAQNCSQDCWKIITNGWEDTEEWEENLGFRSTRTSCSSKPESCVNFFFGPNGVMKDFERLYTCTSADPSLTTDYALQWSQLSLDYPKVHEQGFDDFIGRIYYWNQDGINVPNLLEQFINNLKYHNPNLKFGFTLYEDELSNWKRVYLTETYLPQSIKNRVDYIHLYLHHRKNSPNYESYVNQVKGMFPNAKIIAGSYAYDRIDYMACSQSGTATTAPCTKEEELRYFNIAIAIQANLLKRGKIDSIEFYPGSFGNEESWPTWNNERICKPERKQECIQNTKTMRENALKILNCYQSGTCHNSCGNLVCETNLGETSTNCSFDCQVQLPGDANGDGVVNSQDLELLKQDYLGAPAHNTDFNSDGRVDCEDFAILQANYLKA